MSSSSWMRWLKRRQPSEHGVATAPQPLFCSHVTACIVITVLPAGYVPRRRRSWLSWRPSDWQLSRQQQRQLVEGLRREQVLRQLWGQHQDPPRWGSK
jgi:hypothetical protein